MPLRKMLIGCILQLALLQAVYAREGVDSSKMFKVANLLQSNMVIQQKKPFTFWGVAPAGDEVKIQADWTNKTTTTHANADGQWAAEVKIPAAIPGDFMPHNIIIIHQKDTVKLSNVLIGEVWICSGQSNMGMQMNKIPGWSTGVINYEKELAEANYPAIRLFRVEMGIEFEPMADAKGTWQECTTKTAGDFSAVAYYFGRELFNRLQVPIGLVDAAIPATACQEFTDRQLLDADTVLRKRFVDPYVSSIAAIEAKNDKSTTLATLLYPGLVYNKMIFPLKKLSIKGFTWYQGESNKDDTLLYPRLCTAMLNGWRKDFAQGDLPFYYVQVAPYSWLKKDSTADDYAKFREAQQAMLKVKSTGMAVIMDVGEPNNIHPLNKKPVGVRLASIALAKTYHVDGIVYQGPIFSKFEVKDDKVKISFSKTSVGSGLTTNDGKAPQYFYVAGADKKFYKAATLIVGNQVWLKAHAVPNPVAVRYAFTNYPVTNFCNKEGFPAAPFRTDNWNN